MHLLASTVSNGRMTVHYEMEECRKEGTAVTQQCTSILLREVGTATHETQQLVSELSYVG